MGSEVTAAPIGRAAYRKDDFLGYWAMNRGWRGATSSAALATVVLAAALAPNSTESAVANGDTRTVTFSNQHTNEEASFTYMVNGVYDQAVLDKLNWFMRDWRLNEPTKMDPKLFDIIWEVYRESGSQQPIDVLSGYRSPQTNAMLRRRSRQVAERSEHMLGKAIDAHFLDVSTARIRDIAMRMQEGGVGFYPTGITPWVHIDSGGIRYWPRMSRDALTRLFPDGKTVFIPADGQPMPGYDLGESRDRAARRRGPDGERRRTVRVAVRRARRRRRRRRGGRRPGGGRRLERRRHAAARHSGGVAPRPRRSRSPKPDRRRWRKPSAACRRVRPTPNPRAPSAAPAPSLRLRRRPPRQSLSPSDEVVAALEQPQVASDADTDATVKLTGPIAALYLAPLPPRRPPNLEQQLALLADIPLPPIRPADLTAAAQTAPAPLPPARPAHLALGPEPTGSPEITASIDAPAAGPPERPAAETQARRADRQRQTLAERHHPGPVHAPDRRGARPGRSPEIPGCGQQRAALPRGRADRPLAADANPRRRSGSGRCVSAGR